MRKVLLYGGAFDPPHIGHYFAACKALAVNNCRGFEELWFLPCFNDMNKNVSHHKHRLHMLHLMLRDCNSSRMSICSHEITNRITGGTYMTVKSLRRRYPDIKFMFVVGSDQMEILKTWRKYKELLETIEFFSVPRNISVSSTRIREFFNHDGAVSCDYITTRVNKYILDHNLYKGKNTCK